jgi:hypothetical protein
MKHILSWELLDENTAEIVLFDDESNIISTVRATNTINKWKSIKK